MANESELGSINIEPTENGCMVRISTKVKDKKAFDGYRYETCTYNADKSLVETIMKAIGNDEEVSEESPFDAAKFLGDKKMKK